MSTFRYPQQGVNNVGAYQVSGVPYLSGSTLLTSNFGTNDAEVRFQFPTVSRAITVINTGNAEIKAHFNSLGDGNVSGGLHFVSLPAARDSFTFNVKAKEVFVSLVTAGTDGECQVIAELTSIPTRDFPTLTGSGLTE